MTDALTSYSLLTYGTLIADNTFDGNMSGMRGTALLVEQISELQVVNNKFLQNGPVHAYKEMQQSPYYVYFLD